MQDLVGGDYIRTPVKICVPDNLVFVGGINGFGRLKSPAIT
jgi:hypothetical protein